MKFVYLNLILCVVIIVSSTSATPFKKEDGDTKTTIKEDLETKPSYEITENIVDVPDTRPKLPIIANHNVQKPLNLAKPDTNVEKSTKFSLIQIQSETEVQAEFFNEFDKKEDDILYGIKKYFKGLKKNILNGIHSWLTKKIDEDCA